MILTQTCQVLDFPSASPLLLRVPPPKNCSETSFAAKMKKNISHRSRNVSNEDRIVCGCTQDSGPLTSQLAALALAIAVTVFVVAAFWILELLDLTQRLTEVRQCDVIVVVVQVEHGFAVLTLKI